MPIDRLSSRASVSRSSLDNSIFALPTVASELITLDRGSYGTLLLARCATVSRDISPSAYIDCPHVVLPLAGSYVWHATDADIFADVNRVLCFPGYEDYATSHPISGDVSLAIMLDAAFAARFLAGRDVVTKRGTLTVQRSLPLTHSLQLAARLLVHDVVAGRRGSDTEERVFALIDAIFNDGGPARRGDRNVRAIAKAKEFLHVHRQARLTVGDVADAIGLNTVYLSQLFTEHEGVPLYKYMRKLRLAYAVNQLDACEDITALALDGGFSSHSHFTSAFSTAFGVTPSDVRHSLRRGRIHNFRDRLSVRQLPVARGGHAASARYDGTAVRHAAL